MTNKKQDNESADTKGAVSNDILTPYAAARLVNAELEKAGLAKRVPPQMMYNYTMARLNADKTPLIAFTREGGVDRDALATWTAAYIVKQQAKVVVEA